MPFHRTAKTIDDLLTQARAMLPRRPSPAEAFHAQQNGSLLVDIRGDEQRRADGLIPGAIVLPRNSLEWRCDPSSRWRHPAIFSRRRISSWFATRDTSPAWPRRRCSSWA